MKFEISIPLESLKHWKPAKLFTNYAALAVAKKVKTILQTNETPQDHQ